MQRKIPALCQESIKALEANQGRQEAMRVTSIVADGGGDGAQGCRKGLHGQAALARCPRCALSHNLRPFRPFSED